MWLWGSWQPPYDSYVGNPHVAMLALTALPCGWLFQG